MVMHVEEIGSGYLLVTLKEDYDPIFEGPMGES